MRNHATVRYRTARMEETRVARQDKDIASQEKTLEVWMD